MTRFLLLRGRDAKEREEKAGSEGEREEKSTGGGPCRVVMEEMVRSCP